MTLQVWMINHYALAPDQSGGTRHYNLARLMAECDVETTIFASSTDHATRQDPRLGQHEKRRVVDEQGVRFVWLKTPTYSGNGIDRGLNMLAFLKAVLLEKPSPDLPKPDVIIGSSPHLFGAYGAYLLSKRLRVPFVMEVRDIWPKTLVALGGISANHPLIKVFARLEKILYRKSQLVVSLLQGVPDHIQEIIGRKANTLWIPNGVNIQSFKNAQPFKEGSFRIVYAGAHGLANSLDTVLEAAQIVQSKKIENIEFVLVGDGPDKENLKKRALELDLKNLKFEDPVPKAQIPEILASAHACIMPLLDSPLFEHGISPNKLFDYLASERPVIFAISTSYNAVARAQAGISIPPENPQALADAVVELSKTPIEERQAMGRRGRAYIEEHHDMSKLAARLAEALHGVVEQYK